MVRRRMLFLALALLFALGLPGGARALAGPPDSLKFSTWNLEWLTVRPAGDPALPRDAAPKRPQDIARLAEYAARLNADVIAIEEVDGPAIAARIFPPARYAIHMTDDPVVQRVGLVVRRGIPFTANPDDTAIDPDPHARYPLRSGADITLHLPGGDVRVLAVHLKTGCKRDDPFTSRRWQCRLLARQAPPLEAWIRARQREGIAYIVLGDFNHWMDGPDAFWAALQRAAPLVRATAGHASPCWGGERFIDHILAGGPAAQWMEPATLRVMLYREQGRIWQERLSDHCPVSVRFRIPG
ncbi:MAG: endonuclease/exonuclease/phosphatase family protein [Rhodospirillales bacterium]|nr:endonuclease/exonuclease/phosphatase family protein [Rhodospirillales bacterium]